MALRRHVPGCEDAKLRTFSNNLGVRDSRKCLGRYNLTGRDVLGCARFDDSVCVLPQIVDGYGVLVLGSEGGEVEVPLGAFRCDLDNLMVERRKLLWACLKSILRREKSFCKIFREVFRSFCEVFQSFRKFFEVFASFSRLSDPFGPIGMHSDAFGSNWKRLDVFENFLYFLDFCVVFQCFRT